LGVLESNGGHCQINHSLFGQLSRIISNSISIIIINTPEL
jgi:hypothetical protein